MKNHYTRLLLFYGLLIFTILPILTSAQDCERPWKFAPVCGKIVDYDTGLPISDAQIIGDPTCTPSTTNSNNQGFYCLNLNCCQGCENFPPIRYNGFLTVKASGYCSIRSRPISGHIDSVNFYLSRNCTCNRTSDSLVLVQMSNALNLNWPITEPLNNDAAWGRASPGMFFSETFCVTGINMKPGYGVIANGTLPAAAFATLTGLEEFDSEGTPLRFLSGTLPDMSNFKKLNNFRLAKSKITGGLPASLGKLKNLTQLTVFDNLDLRGSIPPELGNIRELGSLLLYNNNFTGAIPTELGNLKKLYYFYVSENPLSGTIPTGFGTCDSLRHVFFNNCGNLTGQIDFLFRLPKLQYLGLAGNKFSGTIPIVPANPVNSNLAFINLNNNQFDSLPPLTCQRFLLGAKNNKLTFDDILPNLTYFDIIGQTCVSDEHKGLSGYAPQDSIGTEKTITVSVGNTITIDELKIDGALTTNRYQWFKNGNLYGTALNSNKLTIPNLQASNAGIYTCQVTNPAAPLLTLYSRKITLIISCVAPSTPSVGTITQTTCTSQTGSIVLNNLPTTGNWTLTRNPGAITSTGSGSTTTINNLGAGTYTFTVTNETGCISSVSANAVINSPPDAPSTPSVGTITQTTCTSQTGSIVLNNLPTTGTWTLTRNPGAITSTGSGSTTTINNLGAGTYTFTVTNETGCISPISANAVINSPPNAPQAPSVGTITQTTCTTQTGSIVLNNLPTGTWILTRNPGAITSTGTGSTTTINNLGAGTYTFTVTNETGCISHISANAVINSPPDAPSTPSVGTITQTTCTTQTGSIVLNNLPTTGTWTLTRNPGAISSTGSGSTATISNLSAGTYTFTVTNETGCISPISANAVINSPPNAPQAPSVGTIMQTTCTSQTGSIVLNNLPTTGTWTLTRNPGAITSTGSSSTTTISNLGAGTYTFTVTNETGCISPISANAVINTPPNAPSTPSVGTITQTTCTTQTGSIVLNNLPTGTWTLTRNPGAITSTGSGSTTTINNLGAGTYTFTVTNETGCISSISANAVINTPPNAPQAPSVGTITQTTCTSQTGSIVLNNLPTGTWTLTRNPGAITSTGSGSTTTINNLGAGTYTFTATNETGCISPISANAVINTPPDAPSPPSVGAITQTTCTTQTGSIVLNNLPTGTWILTRNPGAITSTGSGSTTTINNLGAGTYTFTVTNETGCISPVSANAVINSPPDAPSTPSVGTITQTTCTSQTGSIVLNNLPTTGTWTLTRNPGAITSTGSGSTTTINNLGAGTYTFTVTNETGCISPISANAVINSPPNAPQAPSVGTITQTTCTSQTGSIVLNNLPTTGTWTLTRNPGAITSTGSGSTTTISNLGAGTYTFTVTNATGCSSSISANAVINSPPNTPSTPSVGTITQTTCTSQTGSIVLNNLPTGTWTLTRNPGAITSTGTGSTTTINNLGAGTYTFTVTNEIGCISPISANAVINTPPDAPSTPSVGTITQTTCTTQTGSIVLNNLPTGTWILTRNPGAITSTGTGSTTTINNLGAGTYTFTITNETGCISPISANAVINTSPNAPSTPSVGTITQTTCTSQTGSIVLNNLPTTGNWTLTRNPGAITSTGSGSTTTINNLGAGTYTFTVTNETGCISPVSVNAVINTPPDAPSTPSVGTITQTTCTTQTGSIVLNNLPTTGTWTLTRNPGAISSTGSGSTTTISNLGAGTYTFTATNETGCSSPISANAVINSPPNAPEAPIVGKITAPPCDSATGSVVLSGLPATGTWTINPKSQTGTGASTIITGLAEGTYIYTVTNDKGCISSPSTVVVTCTKDTIEKCLSDLSNKIPNGFTPGGNGVNDYFDPEKYLSISGCSSNVKAEELYIINRWGEMIFKAQPYEKWDGKSTNQKRTAPSSAYYYILVLKVGNVRKSVKGVINLFAD